jgi:uncharacterized protein
VEEGKHYGGNTELRTIHGITATVCGTARVLAGGTLVSPGLLEQLALGAAPAWAPQSLRAVDAGRLRVSTGPWTVLPQTVPGVCLENLHLRMPDGVRINAFLYLPDRMAKGARIPGLIRKTPYRHGPRTDSFWARHDYASLFVDVRGTGGSEGVPEDEYSEQEHEDTLHIIDWLSKQPWSNGSIGMYGLSYSAFNSVQIAMVEPPALKAILAKHGTDDRYTDDVHYMGGVLQMIEHVWGIGMVPSNIMPGAPNFDVNSEASRTRFESPPWVFRWIEEQTDGPYWRHGSLRPRYDQLTIPTYLLGGWLDGYQNFVPRTMHYSPAVTKGILGPWKPTIPTAQPRDPPLTSTPNRRCDGGTTG